MNSLDMMKAGAGGAGGTEAAAGKELNWVEISAGALEHNFQTLAGSLPGVAVAPVLKSNAYGHGLELVAPVLDCLGPARLMVDSWGEAERLRQLSLSTPIVIMGHVHDTNLTKGKLDYELFVSDLRTARLLAAHQPGARIHLFVDTGMHREGLPLAELEQLVSELPILNLKVVGLASHLATADESSGAGQQFARHQEEQFARAYQILRAAKIKPEFIHLSASAGAQQGYGLGADLPGQKLVRVGLASYGILPMVTPTGPDLRPALSLYSTIVELKDLEVGGKVGYGITYQAKTQRRLALLPIGYFEGLDRRLSNLGQVKVAGQFCPLVGRISMNLSVIDVTDVPGVKLGESVEVFGADPQAANSIAAAAQLSQTIPYELLVKIIQDLARRLVA